MHASSEKKLVLILLRLRAKLHFHDSAQNLLVGMTKQIVMPPEISVQGSKEIAREGM